MSEVDGRRPFGILGGTFDPIHLGHLALAREAMHALDLERMLFVPNADPPHKPAGAVTPAVHREAMVALAIAPEPAFALSRIELERPGPSYAVDTVAELAALAPAEGRPEPWFVLSAEALEDFPTWHEPERILEHVRLAVAPRPGAVELDPGWVAAHYPGREDRFAFLPGPMLDIASTAVRARVAAGEPVDELVPPSVARYIAEHGLYEDDAAAHDGAADHKQEDPNAVNDEQDARPIDPEASASAPDPRQAPTPGLPAGRAADQPRPRLAVVDGIDPDVLAMAHRVVDLAADKKASDIVLLDVRAQTTMTDYFVICTGASDRQLNAIADGIVGGLKEDGDLPLSREGEASSHWLLIDFGGVIVHVMSKPEREFYQLERLWSEAQLLLHVV